MSIISIHSKHNEQHKCVGLVMFGSKRCKAIVVPGEAGEIRDI